MQGPVVDISLVKGKTFEYQFLYADERLVYRPIMAIVSLAPLRLTVPSHGLPEYWPVWLAGISQPGETNRTEAIYATVIDGDTLEINGLDGTGWAALEAATGRVFFYAPVDLTGWSAQAVAKDRVGGTLLLTWDSVPANTPDGLIDISTARSAFVVTLSAAETAALTWTKGVWELEATDPAGKVHSVVAISRVVVTEELPT